MYEGALRVNPHGANGAPAARSGRLPVRKDRYGAGQARTWAGRGAGPGRAVNTAR
jgi:hypothetical protein